MKDIIGQNLSEQIEMTNRIQERLVSAKIKDIVWKHIFMHVQVEVSFPEHVSEKLRNDLVFYLVSANYRTNGRFHIDGVDESSYHLSLNITNPGYGFCLQNGCYHIFVCRGEDILCEPEIDIEFAPLLTDRSTMFLHNQRNMGYSVQFFISEEDEDLHLEILTQDMKRKGIDKFNELDVSPASSKKKRKTIVEKIEKKYLTTKRKHDFIRAYYARKLSQYRDFSEKNGKMTILFFTEQSEELSANLVAVINRLKERGLENQFMIYTSARNMVGKGGYGRRSWMEFIEKLAKADIVFVDDHCPFMDWMRLDEKHTVVQLWHAGAGYKSSGYSRWGHKGSPRAFCCHRQYDYGITASKNIAHFFSEVFGINTEQILPTGMPRMDAYLDSENRKTVTKRLYQQYPACVGKKVILFAPTYRGRNRATAYYPYDLIDFDALYDLCGEEYIVFFKMHPWVADEVPIKEEQRDRFFDLNQYSNINELFYVTDLLVTDYSSSVFEFSLMRKPMLFFAFDEYQYAYSRGFHRDYRSATPGKICHTFTELLQAIRDKDFEFEKNESYVEFHFDHVDAHASDRVIDWFLLGQMPEEYTKVLEQIREENERMKLLDFSCLNPQQSLDL